MNTTYTRVQDIALNEMLYVPQVDDDIAYRQFIYYTDFSLYSTINQ